ncbi:hypothetical protein FD24_GL001539 [Lactiplantibacillus pentosus DSM 20314]|uniref:Uncharacterized protein n=1 Tax=Lactiplantibacillus pentosus DSM 20314 TaxID=1423791 RepID=A0A837REX1_LACPE|nr:hypothetical protein FD24_GL001539 [Lactiplantibacillus pentosus DSM 20314]
MDGGDWPVVVRYCKLRGWLKIWLIEGYLSTVVGNLINLSLEHELASDWSHAWRLIR